MGSTQAMSTGVVIVAGPTVMHRPPLKAGPDPNLFQCLVSSFAVPGIQGQPACRIDMHPMEQSLDADACFIGVLERASYKQRFDALDGWF